MRTPTEGITASETVVLQACATYIREHVADDLSLEKLARRFGWNRFHLTRDFKRMFGVSIHQYCIAARMACACSWLLHTDTPVKNLPKLVGYRSRNFYQRFLLYFGCTPEQFRKTNGHSVQHSEQRLWCTQC